jgi:predicted metalloprotease with PDZ domain
MATQSRLPRAVLVTLAAAYAAATVVYSAVWMVYARRLPAAELGLQLEPRDEGRGVGIKSVGAGSEAARRGLRAGDELLKVDGRPLADPYYEPFSRQQPGETVVLTVKRAGAPEPLELTAVLQPRRDVVTVASAIAVELIRAYPLPFVVVGLVVLFSRLEDRNAWLLALLFGGFICGAPSFT